MARRSAISAIHPCQTVPLRLAGGATREASGDGDGNQDGPTPSPSRKREGSKIAQNFTAGAVSALAVVALNGGIGFEP